jgi:hypothetical protein
VGKWIDQTKKYLRVIDLEDGNLVGIDIYGNASKFVDLSKIALEKC